MELLLNTETSCEHSTHMSVPELQTLYELLEPLGCVEHQVVHFKQRYNWDCGVTCVLMLLQREQRPELIHNLEEVCCEEGFGKSTWTIDLCYLLKRYGVRHCMYTRLLGVNESHKSQKYYNRIISLDRERVKQRFKEASASGIDVREAELSTRELLKHLALHGPVILLVDSGLLVCDLCKHNKLKAEFRLCFGGSYAGHYIVVVGWSARRDRLLYRDPALSPRLCAAARRHVIAAAKAPGTDRDAILIYKNFR